VMHTRFDNDNCRILVNSIKGFIIPGSAEQPLLARELNISVPMANQIKSVEYAVLNERLMERFKDSIHVMLPFKIEVDVYDYTILDTLEKKILNYIENNEFITKRKEIDLVILENTQRRINEEIAETDSLKNL